jgi:exopolyphosphatase/pppGpp-phosphohydrolase
MHKSIRLHIGAEQTTVSVDTDGEPAEVMLLAIGQSLTAAEFFKHSPPTEAELEAAIMWVEDEVTRARALVAGHTMLTTTDAAIREIARIAGLPPQAEMLLSVEAVERLFDLLAVWSLGRPALRSGIPTDPAFAATLLILREFMHHLHFACIQVLGPPADAKA